MRPSSGATGPAAEPPVEPLSDEHLACPFEADGWLRDHAPVYVTDDGVHVVSRHDDVVAALHDHGTFSNRFGRIIRGRDRLAPEALEVLEAGWPPVDTLFTTDPPQHRRFRSLVNKAFTPRRVRELEPQIREVAERLVDACVARGRVDLVEDLAVPLPLTVIADQLGVPRDDLHLFKRWSRAVVTELGRHAGPDEQVAAARATVEFQHYFHARIEQRRAEPRDDILSDLVHARIEGERPLDDRELLMMLQQLLVAGNETTTNGIASMVARLLDHPDVLAEVRRDRALVAGVVEETLRLESPIQGMWRVAADGTEVAGCPIPRGAVALLRYGAANRDPRRYEHADVFDPRRTAPRDHLAFGAGIHFCVGASLARAEMAIALEVLLDRTREIRDLEGVRDHVAHLLIRGPTRLPVELVAV